MIAEIADSKPYSPYPPRLYLTGYMGAGKSTIGKRLAGKLGYRFLDTDHELMKRYDKTMTRIFKEDGEEAFRKSELSLLEELAHEEKLVISTGGGTLVREETCSIALATGTVIYLAAPPEILFERVIFSPKDRPMIDVPDAEKVFISRFKEREPFYLRSHITVPSQDRKPGVVVDEIMSKLATFTAQ